VPGSGTTDISYQEGGGGAKNPTIVITFLIIVPTSARRTANRVLKTNKNDLDRGAAAAFFTTQKFCKINKIIQIKQTRTNLV
jgi:hypothetical protein